MDVVLRSPFAASSGLGDRFESAQELVGSSRAGLDLGFTSSARLPFSSSSSGAGGRGYIRPNGVNVGGDDSDDASGRLNAYVLDLWKHGQAKALVRYNKVPTSYLFANLKNFSLVLRALAVAVRKKFLEEGHGGVGERRLAQLLTRLAAEFHDKFRAFNY